MRVKIHPSVARGAVTAPPSKSMAHRLLVCAALAQGESIVHNLAMSDDIRATIACLTALGAEIEISGDTATVRGFDPRQPAFIARLLPCGASGSTLRFMIPLCLVSGKRRTLTGSPRLMSRPLSVYEDICYEQGLIFERAHGAVSVKGALTPGVYEVAGDISSQFISGLLFALPMLGGDSELRIIPPVESRPYIDMTVDAMRRFGVEVVQDGNTYKIPGNQHYRPVEETIEGDWSNAAFLEALNLAGGEVTVEGLNDDSLQGDKCCKALFDSIRSGGARIDIADCPDLGPVLFAAAAMKGGAAFTGTRRLTLKESDRAKAMQQELSKFGVSVEVGENTAAIQGELKAPAQPLQSHGDHRIVMALAVLATVTGGEIDGAEDVAKSYPDFFEQLKALGVEVEINGMDQPL